MRRLTLSYDSQSSISSAGQIRWLIGCGLLALVIGWPVQLEAQTGKTDPRLSSDSPAVNQQQQNAQKRAKQNAKPNTNESAKPPVAKPLPVGKARVAELLGFVDQHHAELRPLLRSLQKNRPQQFQNAMRALDREVQALQNLKERAPQRYRRSLKQWVNRSQTKLLAAQLVVKKSDRESAKIRQQMSKLINEYYDLRADQLKEDISALEKRSQRLRQQLNQQQQDRNGEVERQIDLLTRNAKGLRPPSPRAGGKDAGDPAPEKNKKKD